MLRQQARLFNRFSIAFDTLVVVFSFLLAFKIRSRFSPPLLFSLHYYAWTLLIVIPVWLYLLTRFKLFSSIRRFSLFDIFTRLVTVHIWGGIITAAVIFFIDRNVFSRSLFLLFVFLLLVMLTLEKLLFRYGLGALRRRGLNFREVLVVGTQDSARKFQVVLQENEDWGLRIIGFLTIGEDISEAKVEGTILGDIRNLVAICKRRNVDEVVFCLPKDQVIDAEAYFLQLEELGITVRMVLDFYQTRLARKDLSFFHEEIPILTFHTKSLNYQDLLAKRCLDIFGALAGLFLTALLFPVIALAIKLDSPGPVFFGQDRVGENGRTFKLWKFRSMYVDAEARKKELMERNEMIGAIFKMKDDPRITRVGKFLRRTSLDELPQFWTVLHGEMSLVGTRPPTPEEVREYENWHRRRISIKPGITGIWQTSGRNQVKDFDDIVRYDLQYIDTWSLWLDIRILFKTIAVVFSREGSC